MDKRMTTMTRDEMLTALNENVCLVTYTKACGCGREVKLTRLPSEMPANSAAALAERASKEGSKEETIDTWDMWMEAYKTFKVASVTLFAIDDGGPARVDAGSGTTDCDTCDG